MRVGNIQNVVCINITIIIFETRRRAVNLLSDINLNGSNAEKISIIIYKT